MAREVESRLGSAAESVVLHLYKRRVAIDVEDEWLYVVGRQFAARASDHPELRFASRR
jgi:hypothetical protein